MGMGGSVVSSGEAREGATREGVGGGGGSGEGGRLKGSSGGGGGCGGGHEISLDSTRLLDKMHELFQDTLHKIIHTIKHRPNAN
jgi:hypothetical protein